jgi:hypothetical protein
MLITPQEMLATSVAQLETLAAFLSEQLAESIDTPGHGPAEVDLCNEILGCLTVLIHRVRTRQRHAAGIRLWRHSW